jgi:Arc/MetJ family transcription regulator
MPHTLSVLRSGFTAKDGCSMRLLNRSTDVLPPTSSGAYAKRSSNLKLIEPKQPNEPANVDKLNSLVYVYTHKEVYMRTNIFLDDNLVKEALKLSRARTKKELVNQALKEFVENRKRLNLMDLFGKIEFAKNYDYKALREGK